VYLHLSNSSQLEQHHPSPELPSLPKYSISVFFKHLSVTQKLRTAGEMSTFSEMSLLLSGTNLAFEQGQWKSIGKIKT
jgi:hypothetical protein